MAKKLLGLESEKAIELEVDEERRREREKEEVKDEKEENRSDIGLHERVR